MLTPTGATELDSDSVARLLLVEGTRAGIAWADRIGSNRSELRDWEAAVDVSESCQLASVSALKSQLLREASVLRAAEGDKRSHGARVSESEQLGRRGDTSAAGLVAEQQSLRPRMQISEVALQLHVIETVAVVEAERGSTLLANGLVSLQHELQVAAHGLQRAQLLLVAAFLGLQLLHGALQHHGDLVALLATPGSCYLLCVW